MPLRRLATGRTPEGLRHRGRATRSALFGLGRATAETFCRHSDRVKSTSFGGSAASGVTLRGCCELGRDRFDKIIAIAVNPATYEEEAITALRKARELVKENRALAHPEPAPPPPPPQPDYCFQVDITNIPTDWVTLVAHSLSKEAYGLGLKSKIEYDFSDTPLSLNVRADGSKAACRAFEKHFTRLIDFVNAQQRQPKICTIRSLAACDG
jgi:hypothetical protein